MPDDQPVSRVGAQRRGGQALHGGLRLLLQEGADDHRGAEMRPEMHARREIASPDPVAQDAPRPPPPLPTPRLTQVHARPTSSRSSAADSSAGGPSESADGSEREEKRQKPVESKVQPRRIPRRISRRISEHAKYSLARCSLLICAARLNRRRRSGGSRRKRRSSGYSAARRRLGLAHHVYNTAIAAGATTSHVDRSLTLHDARWHIGHHVTLSVRARTYSTSSSYHRASYIGLLL